jgi:hypothetical protein
MSRREKVLVTLMGLAVGCGVVGYLLPAACVSARERAPLASRDEAVEFAVASQARLGEVTCGPQMRHAESQLSTTWTNNPFTPLEAELVPASARRSQVGTFSGFVSMEGRHYAVLNGRAYGVGARVGTTGYDVVSITPQQVVLRIDDGSETVTLTLTNENENETGGTR